MRTLPLLVCLSLFGCRQRDTTDPVKHDVRETTGTAPCLLTMYKSGMWIIRGKAASVLVQALAVAPQLDPAVRAAVHDVILVALQDSRPSVRLDTVEALGRCGKADAIPALQRGAHSDPYAGGSNKKFLVRESAMAAIASIEERAKASGK